MILFRDSVKNLLAYSINTCGYDNRGILIAKITYR
jgi:hypothetical protein